MNLKEIREIMKLMGEHALSEVEVEREGIKLKIKKGMDCAAVPMVQPMSVSQAVPAPAVQIPEPRVEGGPSRSASAVEINSPMVGTFYRASAPESPSFIEIGQMVDVGQVVCIVEAMKLMNEIKSEVKGKVVDVFVNNAEPVEFGQALFLVESA